MDASSYLDEHIGTFVELDGQQQMLVHTTPTQAFFENEDERITKISLARATALIEAKKAEYDGPYNTHGCDGHYARNH